MITLITGASHTGKTLLAQKMLEKYKYPYLSIDQLKMGLIRSGNTNLTPEDDDELTDYLWPIVREMIKTAIENEQNLIVEGCYIPFNWRQDLEERYLSYIDFICLAMTEGYIECYFDDIIGHESEIESRLVDTDCSIASLKADNQYYIDGFMDAGENVVMIEDNYEKTLKAIVENNCIEAKKVIGTSVAETVVCLDKKKPKDYIEIGVDAEDYYKIKDSEEAR